jgi:hypothetical protein
VALVDDEDFNYLNQWNWCINKDVRPRDNRQGYSMKVNQGLFSSASIHWATPKDLYDALDAEFRFNDDPCPLNPLTDGLARRWGSSTYCNPPYGKEIGIWLKKAYEESLQGGGNSMPYPVTNRYGMVA